MTKQLSPFEALEDLRNYLDFVKTEKFSKANLVRYFNEKFNIIETALKENQERIEELEETNHLMFLRERKTEKKLKALEIIKDNLNVEEILFSAKGVCNSKDYDLLKEVLHESKM